MPSKSSSNKLSSSSVKIAKQQLRAIAVAERGLRRRLEDIAWRETELADALDDVDALAAAGKIPNFSLVPGGIRKLLSDANDKK